MSEQPDKPKSAAKPLLCIFTVVILALTGVSVYQFIQLRSKSDDISRLQSDLDTSKQANIDQPSDEEEEKKEDIKYAEWPDGTAPLKKYKDSTYGFSFEYPSNWNIELLSDTGGHIYKGVTAPSGWRLILNTNPHGHVAGGSCDRRDVTSTVVTKTTEGELFVISHTAPDGYFAIYLANSPISDDRPTSLCNDIAPYIARLNTSWKNPTSVSFGSIPANHALNTSQSADNRPPMDKVTLNTPPQTELDEAINILQSFKISYGYSY